MLTDAGLKWVWERPDSLAAVRIAVGNGDRPFDGGDRVLAGLNDGQTAESPLITEPVIEVVRGFVRVTLAAVFTEAEANFDWRERGVISAGGILIDRIVEDGGRKAPGTIWTTEISIELGRQ